MCQNSKSLDFDFHMAFQPIIDVSDRTIFAYEALARGPNGESAASVMALVNSENINLFDQMCRVKAIEQAVDLNIDSRLSINFLPSAVLNARACINLTLHTASKTGFPLDRLMFEVVESEECLDAGHLKSIFREYESHGFHTAIDDFGAGYAGFGLLIDLLPNIVKLDMSLIRGIISSNEKMIVVNGIVNILNQLSIRPLAEGVETKEEFDYLRTLGIDLYQGYLFAKPEFRRLPKVDWSSVKA